MITFKSIRDNNDYLMIGVKTDLALFLLEAESIPDEIYKEINKIYISCFEFEKENNFNVNHIAIRKDSLIGQFLIKNADSDKILNEDLYIYYDDVVNAINVALFENNNEMVKDILPLFRNQIEGNKINLQKQYSETVLNYISKNNNFDQFLNELNGYCCYNEKDYIVYENGKYEKKPLNKSNSKIKMINQK